MTLRRQVTLRDDPQRDQPDRTSDEGVVTKLTADLDPRGKGFVIPDDYHSDELSLWRMRLRP